METKDEYYPSFLHFFFNNNSTGLLTAITDKAFCQRELCSYIAEGKLIYATKPLMEVDMAHIDLKSQWIQYIVRDM